MISIQPFNTYLIMDNPKQYATEIIRFKTQSIVEKGLIVKNKKREEQFILFSEVHKIYILKHKVGWLLKAACIASFVGMLCFESVYFSDELAFLSSTLFFPAIIKLNLFKWYEMHLEHKGGIVYTKQFYLNTKQEHIQFLHRVRNRIFECQMNSISSFSNTYSEDEVIIDCSHFSLIA
ncbi:hypothetical protein [Flavobacterium nackdongense]|uniref:Uncharacterized protein n=1 Tax=Flavobacterium nackdongense TaxID=2547394 RepID=A0A4P6Y5L3_9FLAO|nr:hypothetical protein [Flavobacterium nackdongense]QBN17456.1 hypothetical protein E1750_01125 [Flavobacterium nackdongense]